MLDKLKALVKRWFHCLTHFHRGITCWDKKNKISLIACDCGKIFYKSNLLKDFSDQQIVDYIIKGFFK